MVKYRMADCGDIELLSEMRLSFLEIDKSHPKYSEVYDNCCSFFGKSIPNNTCEAVIAEKEGIFIGVGIMFYYESVPSVFNTTGRNAYIACMYVEPEFRGQGIGTEILKKLMKNASERGYVKIMLNSSEMGRHMYEKMGFEDIRNGMIYSVG